MLLYGQIRWFFLSQGFTEVLMYIVHNYIVLYYIYILYCFRVKTYTFVNEFVGIYRVSERKKYGNKFLQFYSSFSRLY